MKKPYKILISIIVVLVIVAVIMFFVLKKTDNLPKVLDNEKKYRGSQKPNEYKYLPPEGRPFNSSELNQINDPDYKRVYDKALEMGYRFTYEVPNANMETINGIMVTKPTKSNFQQMANALEIATGDRIVIRSGYRSVNRQYNILKSNLSIPYSDSDIVDYLDGKSFPGTSTHHTGRAIDICLESDSFNSCLNANYWTNGNGKRAYKWLKENAGDFGFELTYPENARSMKIGAYFEPWHWEYKG